MSAEVFRYFGNDDGPPLLDFSFTESVSETSDASGERVLDWEDSKSTIAALDFFGGVEGPAAELEVDSFRLLKDRTGCGRSVDVGLPFFGGI